ncbi:hypothetical protein [Zhenhengia sp.]|uniref:hypothetical protein n=1 Tax=Zhenhengia sp. TaxID=2944208 RepID=UPI0039942694
MNAKKIELITEIIQERVKNIQLASIVAQDAETTEGEKKQIINGIEEDIRTIKCHLETIEKTLK